MIPIELATYTLNLSAFLNKYEKAAGSDIVAIISNEYIESIFLRINPGSFLLKEDKHTGNRYLIHGNKRFINLLRYRNEEFRLDSRFPCLHNKIFSEIPVYLQNRFDDTLIRYEVIYPSGDDVLLEYYYRITELI